MPNKRKPKPKHKPLPKPKLIPEIEGDRYGWFYVCPVCHAQIVWNQKECIYCREEFNWNG